MGAVDARKRRGSGRPRLPGIDVRPGSIREARLATGLSLSQLAGEELSRAAIHLLEIGQSRPSITTLELIAVRTGRPLSFFLSDPASLTAGLLAPRVDELERLCTSGRHEEALARAADALASIGEPRARAEARYWIGQAAVSLGRFAIAEQHLGGTARLLEDLGDRWLAADCRAWEAQALVLQSSPAASRAVDDALDACRKLEPPLPSTEIKLLGLLAAGHASRGDWPAAAGCCREALDLGATFSRLPALIDHYERLSAAYQQAGHATRSAVYAWHALALRALERDRGLVASTVSGLGYALEASGQLGPAREQLEAAVAYCDRHQLEEGLCGALCALGEMLLRSGERDRAAGLIERAVRHAERARSPLVVARVRQAEGVLAAARGDTERTDCAFERALQLLREAGPAEELLQCHTTYADVLERRGEAGRALEHWKFAVGIATPGLAQRLHFRIA